MDIGMRPSARRRSQLTASALAVASGLAFLSPAGPGRAQDSPAQYSAVSIPDAQIDRAIERLDSLANELMRRSGIPGIAIAVVRDGRTVYAKGFGVRKVGEDLPIDPDTTFQIASLSKSLAASVVAHEVGIGRVSWKTRIVDLLPWFALADPWVSAHVTIADLFAHRSGLPDHAGDDLEDIGFDRQTILQRLRLLPLHGFRDVYAYTNFGLTAAAEAVAVASGKDWTDLSEDVLYKPLGMARTSSRYADFERQANRASGHVKTAQGYEAKHRRLPDAQSPAGGISSTVNDLARWMVMVLDGGRFEGRTVIAPDALLPALRAEVISSPSASVDTRPSFYGYGVGTSISPSGRVVLSHSGAFALGVATHYAMLPSARLGIVVLTNAAPSGVPETMGSAFLDLVQLGAQTRDWFPPYAHMMAGLLAPAGDLVGKVPPAGPAAGPLSNYAGVYANDYFGDVTITVAGNTLQLRIGPAERRYDLRHWAGDTFAVSPSSENEPEGSLSSVVFQREGSGPAQSMTITYLSQNGLGRFVRR